MLVSSDFPDVISMALFVLYRSTRMNGLYVNIIGDLPADVLYDINRKFPTGSFLFTLFLCTKISLSHPLNGTFSTLMNSASRR